MGDLIYFVCFIAFDRKGWSSRSSQVGLLKGLMLRHRSRKRWHSLLTFIPLGYYIELWCFLLNSSLLRASLKGEWPAINSKSIVPTDHTSDLYPYGSLLKTSGAILMGVPQYVVLRSLLMLDWILENPRSAILTINNSSDRILRLFYHSEGNWDSAYPSMFGKCKSRLASLMSLWITPRLCRWHIPSTTW